MVKDFSDNDCNYRILWKTVTMINMVTDFYDQRFYSKNLAKIIQMMVTIFIDTRHNDIYYCQSTHLILKMVVIDDSDDKYDYQKVPMVQSIIMTPNENDKNCGYGTPTFTRTIIMTVSERDDDNS